MRRLLHHILLLALLFHTAVGVPLHAAKHLHVPAQQAPAPHGHLHGHPHAHAHGLVHIEDFSGSAGHAPGCAEEHDGDPHVAHAGSCVWCQQLAQLALALPSAALAGPPTVAAALAPVTDAGWQRKPPARHSPHAARAPPSMN